MSGREKNRAFSCTLSVLAKKFFGPKTVQTRKNYKNSGFSGNCPKAKMTPFFGKKVFFDMGQKVGFTNCVFEKLCFLNTLFYSVFSRTQLFKNKNCMLKKNRKFMKNCGLFLSMANGVFWVWFF